MKVGLGTSHYVFLINYDYKRKTPAGKNFAPKIGRPKFLVTYGDFEHTKILNLAYKWQFIAPKHWIGYRNPLYDVNETYFLSTLVKRICQKNIPGPVGGRLKTGDFHKITFFLGAHFEWHIWGHAKSRTAYFLTYLHSSRTYQFIKKIFGRVNVLVLA